ncbi:MAG: hypothetical protein QGG36_32130 [Pirellulaceae bacterium]|nr:hypothetical protein [Pirellulaceae bacterium]
MPRQLGQGNSIGLAELASWTTFDLRGICTTDPQCGHFPFLPAAEPGVLTTFAHEPQWNSILFGLEATDDSFSGALVEVSGICTTAVQCGHFPFLPAAAAGVFTVEPQCSQANSIWPPAAAGAGFAAADVLGIWTTAWQCGHLPFLPAAEAGVFTDWPHSRQGNSIVLELDAGEGAEEADGI